MNVVYILAKQLKKLIKNLTYPHTNLNRGKPNHITTVQSSEDLHLFLQQPFCNRNNRMVLLPSQGRIAIVRAFVFPGQFVDNALFLIAHIVVI